jgi:hypothetical protein
MMKRAVRFLVALAVLLTAVAVTYPQMTVSCGSPVQSDGCPTPW